jgi:hypothetical protein
MSGATARACPHARETNGHGLRRTIAPAPSTARRRVPALSGDRRTGPRENRATLRQIKVSGRGAG